MRPNVAFSEPTYSIDDIDHEEDDDPF